jgi:protein SCO1/2
MKAYLSALVLCATACVLADAAAADSCCSVVAQAAAHSEDSIYQLGDRWTDHDGHAAPLDRFAGEVVVVGMFFSHCQYVCPRIVADMRRIEDQLAEDEKPEVGFILASMDSVRDLPPVLNAYAQKMRLGAGWSLLHGDERAVRNLAAVLGVKYKRESNGDFGHSVVITVLNPAGEVVHQQEGLGADPADTIATIRKLVHSTSHKEN